MKLFKRYHQEDNGFQLPLYDDRTSYPQTISTINNTAVENVTKFRYHGDKIKYDEPSSGDAEIDLRKPIAENKFYELSKNSTINIFA